MLHLAGYSHVVYEIQMEGIEQQSSTIQMEGIE